MRKILVADDHPGVVRFLQLTLQAEGYDVVTAPDGTAALDRAREEKPDLIILDVTMPGVDGFRVLSRIKSDPDLRHVVVVMLSGDSDPKDIALCLDIGADYYLTKPFGLVEIGSLVRRLLPEEAPSPPGLAAATA